MLLARCFAAPGAGPVLAVLLPLLSFSLEPAGQVQCQRLAPTKFTLAPATRPPQPVAYQQLFIYRAGMHAGELRFLRQGQRPSAPPPPP
eukprot:SAG22_NODE_10134_length_551_cov_1.022124_1_plen_88_part_10